MTPTPLGRIRAVFFDAVGTLLHPSPAADRVYHRVGRRFGSQLERGAVAERFASAFAEQEDLDRQQGLTTSEDREVERWRTIVARVLADVALPEECFRSLYDHFARASAWSVDPDAEETLTWLAERGFRLGLCSNFDQRLRGILAELPQLGRMSDVIISSEIGWRKPAREFYSRLSKQTGLPPQQILVVGDDLENDYRGARQAGLAALLLDPRGRSARQAEETIARLLEVPAWLIRKTP